ncbi:class I SAM-dependent methyltransferase [Leptospira kanakyensis]|uniref:class I SAM-dependent methyltransferase n=1 Tax=Leptospira kanakyensis TaxID=2484968 RepID=UPI00223E8E85|nr:methyltransferase domain-containing protein [Leptospira kanakyensis]MCW7471390.1 class I SAM-dependent methyltransferase [Leptospira kanakyensis]
MINKILDVGCGNKKREGAIGIDFNDRTQADVIHNLNSFPYPFEDAFFSEVFIDNCLEHLSEPMRVMEEIYRITKFGGKVKVIVPYFRSQWAFIDPTHLHFFTVDSFAYYDPSHPICQRYDYTLARFSVKKIVFNETLKNGFFKKLIVAFANKWPRRYEYYLSHLFVLDDITYYLERI